MSNQNSKPQPTAEELAKAKLAQEEKAKADAAAVKPWVSPLDVNYKELETLLGDTDLEDYIGDNLPEEEVKRIKTDFEIYLKNK